MASPTNPQRRVLVSPDELLGHAIDGKYQLDSIIGGGGMGMVYRATQQNLKRPVALKLLKLPKGDAHQSLERFQREIDIVAQLSHPNIVRIFDSGRDPQLGLHYIAMELIEGVGLDRLLANWRFEPELSMAIARGICAALTEPHRLGIVHRDIKPGNILLTVRSDDTLGVKVVDFGISRSIQVEQDHQITSTGEVIGSPQYMAPEAARGVEIDARTDLYAVGVLLYEMISGRPLFQAPTPIMLMMRHLRERPPSLRELGTDELALSSSVPPVLSAMVDRLLSKDPDDRPRSARDMLRELDSIRDHCELHLPHLDGSLSAMAALGPWLHPLNPSSAQADSSFDSLPFFEGWLVPDTAEFLAAPSGSSPASSPALAPSQVSTPNPEAHDAPHTWEHARTLPLQTLDDLSAPNTGELKPAVVSRSVTQLGTGPLVSRPRTEQTEHNAPTPPSPNRTPIVWMGVGLVAVFVTAAALFWPRAEAPNADLPSQAAPPRVPAATSAPNAADLDAPRQDSPAKAPSAQAFEEPDASQADAPVPSDSPSAQPAKTHPPDAPVDSRAQKAPAQQDAPAKPTTRVKDKPPAKQKTPTKQKTPAKRSPSQDDEKLEDGLDWLRKR